MLDTDHAMSDGTGKDNRDRPLSAAARRALAEAEARRRQQEVADAGRPTEIGGRGGHDPARYGDWEVKGLASDF
jgi:hypothetical protein